MSENKVKGKVIVQRPGIISRIFDCRVCTAHFEDYNTASSQALRHAKFNGHTVHGELVQSVIYTFVKDAK